LGQKQAVLLRHGGEGEELDPTLTGGVPNDSRALACVRAIHNDTTVDERWATTSMASSRKDKNLRPAIVPKFAAKKRSQPEDSGAANGGPRTVPRVIEFPKSPTAADVIREKIIFEVGHDRFAIRWRAEIEQLQLPPAGPIAVQRKQ